MNKNETVLCLVYGAEVDLQSALLSLERAHAVDTKSARHTLARVARLLKELRMLVENAPAQPNVGTLIGQA